MNCVSPRIFNGSQVPCGQCIACRQSRSREWSVRLEHELEYWDSAVFVTLTYSDDQVPIDGSIHRSELQRFFKRLRRDLAGRPIRYYAVGEYGGQTGRPHYHAIVFGLAWCTECRCCSRVARRGGRVPQADSDCGLLESAWPLGHVHVGDVTSSSIRYVTGYLGKNYGEEAFGGRTKAFALMSKGLGLRWMRDHRQELVSNPTIRRNGRSRGLPRYYQKKLAESFCELADWYGGLLRSLSVRRARARDAELARKLSRMYDCVHMGYGVARMRHQVAQNLRARVRVKESKL